MCALRSHNFHAIRGFAERVLLSSNRKTHHDGRKHQCFTPHMESMLTEAECYCAKLPMAIFLEKCCENCQSNSLADCSKTNKQQSSNTADMQQSINVRLCTPRHLNSSTETAWYTHPTRIDVFRRQTTHGHTRTNTQTNREWLVGRLVGTEQKLMQNPKCFPEKVLNST